ncbi:hypothetical protein BYT27DRAFT_7132530 [Phlegmacium glaucopus]|nr:hypothetical protein BYT27DRAFT_7132530 [Phlegmacium glaucopus]
MIQQTSVHVRQAGPEVWGQWSGRKHYSLEVVQQPLRARMCGFGDKDRRPLAPAAVAKMVVRREDDSIVDVDDLDCSFFLVTVDLWSADGQHEMNLVLHPSSTERYAPHSSSKSKRRGTSTSATNHRPTPAGHSTPTPSHYRPSETTVSTPSISAHAPYGNQGYYMPQPHDNISYPPGVPYGPLPPDPSAGWGYSPPIAPADRSTGFPPSALPAARPELEVLPYRAWNTDTAYAPVPYANQELDPALQAPSSPGTPYDNSAWNQSNNFGIPSLSNPELEQGNYGPAAYHSQAHQPAYAQYPPSISGSPPPSTLVTPATVPPLPRHTYTRTLVGPLSANACRLLDEHRKPGIFFLFQDLSVRTEGAFRLRMRLMNVGAPPAPETGAIRIHTDVSPILAQAFTEQFMVYSAKRFPGVPDTTALSIAFGNQGQKLPLRNRHGSSKRQRRGDSGSEDDSDG